MHWSDEGIVLGLRRHGETGVVLETLTRAHGRHLGLVHGGRSRRMQPVLQAGNGVSLVWRARLDEQLGSFTVEPAEQRSARLMAAPLALYGLGSLAALLRHLPERDPHPALYEAASSLVEHLDDPDLAPALMVMFELSFLAELGFGLDLGACAVTGTPDDLAYVSPRSGRAVSAPAGEPYRDKLLPLPRFLVHSGTRNRQSPEEIDAGFALTGYFLDRHVFAPQGAALPEERARFVAAARKVAG